MNTNIWWLLAILIVAIGIYSACAGSKNTAAAKEKIQQGARVIDVRTAGEFAGGHYPGAVNIPVQELKSRLSEAGPKDKPVVVYCRSGNRSASAQKILREAGFKDITNAGGLSDLRK